LLSSVAFEAGSTLLRIESCAFYECSSLSSIWIPSSVEELWDHCFGECQALRRVTFEPGSKFSVVPPSCWRPLR
jgi:hypothetical protein